MNRQLYKHTAQQFRQLAARQAALGARETVLLFVHAAMEVAARAYGVPVSSWVLQADLQPSPEELPGCSAALLSQATEVLASIPEEEWRRYPELPGWLYQYILEERKDSLFAGFKRGKKAGPEDIPAVTQLFTPEWIARYMAENTIGRLWADSRPDSALAQSWRYFDNEAAGNSPREEQRKEAADPAGADSCLSGQRTDMPDIASWAVLDPACGCGHLLTAAFDVLLGVYAEAGVEGGQAARQILRANLHGLDIDPLAVRICRFVLLLKAAQIDPAIVREPIRLGIAAFAGDAPDEFGSLLRMDREAAAAAGHRADSRLDCDVEQLTFDLPLGGTPMEHEASGEIAGQPEMSMDTEAASLLLKRYHVVITNPPYLGRRNMSDRLAAFLDREYPRGRNDLFAAFLERGLELLRPGGYHAAINQQSWMFLSGYEELRAHILQEAAVVSLLHLGTRSFEDIGGEVVQSVCFVMRHSPGCGETGAYWMLTQEGSPAAKEAVYANRPRDRLFLVRQSEFAALPGKRFAYGLPASWRRLFRELPPLSSLYAVKKGMDTGCNERYVRFWHEVPEESLSFRAERPEAARWFPYAKGGGQRKWYGNHYYVVRWSDNGAAIRRDPRSNLRNAAYYGRPGITWSTVSTGSPGFRLLEPGFLFDNGGSCLFPLDRKRTNHCGLLAYLNSGVAVELLRQMNPTLNVQPGDVARLPLDPALTDDKELIRLGAACVELARAAWDETEWSWNYLGHPVAAAAGSQSMLREGFERYMHDRQQRESAQLALEQEIDRRVYAHYGLEPVHGEGQPEQEPVLSSRTLKEEMTSFLSYAAGCALNVYPVDGERPYAREPAVVTPEMLVHRLENWLRRLWGEEQLQQNLQFIAAALGCRKKEEYRDRMIRFFRDEWYTEHKSSFGGRPLYLRICSGPRGALIAYAPVRMISGELAAEAARLAERLAEQQEAGENLSEAAEELRSFADGLRRRLAEEREEARESAVMPGEAAAGATEKKATKGPAEDEAPCARSLYSRYGPLLSGL
ncbi:MAG: Eco57I restriction endonuclease [Paenibacillaceae bacterium]|nr:Eco57I restriction endonuclease [Paenibacillaceae bacterium]